MGAVLQLKPDGQRLDAPSFDEHAVSWSKTASAFEKTLTQGTLVCSMKTIEMVEQLHPITPESRVLEIGAGTGSITRTVRKKHPETSILATDIAPGMIEALAKQNIPGVVTAVANGADLDRKLVPDESFSHAIGGLMIQFCGDGQISVCRELYRSLIPGGVAALSISSDVVIPEPWHKACELVDPSRYHRVDLHDSKAWRTTGEVRQGFETAGFVDIQEGHVHMKANFASVDEYLEFWFHGKHPLFERMINAWQGDVAEVMPTLKTILQNDYGTPITLGGMAGIVVGRNRRNTPVPI